MIDSTNPRQLADNIRKLWDKFKSISGDLLPSRSTATTAQILKLTGENKTPVWADEYSYTPPAYSETEVNTGQKWIDGKDVYRLVYNGTFPEITTLGYVTLLTKTVETLVSMEAFARYNPTGGIIPLNNQIPNATFTAFYAPATGIFTGYVNTTFSESTYTLIIYYTKPDPVPSDAKGPETDSDQEPEPETKKTTKKKTTK